MTEAESAHAALAILGAHLGRSRLSPTSQPQFQRAARALALVAVAAKPAGPERLRELVEGEFKPELAASVLALAPPPDALDALAGLSTLDPARLYEELLTRELEQGGRGFEVIESLSRRRAGSHFTPVELARDLVARCLKPLTDCITTEASLLQLEVCDPAAGAGVFLRASADFLAEKLISLSDGLRSDSEARALVIGHCLVGCDLDPIALWLARCALGGSDAGVRLLEGDALVDPELHARTLFDAPGLALSRKLPEVFDRERPGFDAIVGNPPWVAFVGRAAQPLPRERREFFAQHYEGFRKYRTLHGLFVERSAALLREGGRMALLLPTSVVDLDGYAPLRQAHDALCQVDTPLPDYGADAFDEVFQPCVGLLSTRRAKPRATPVSEQWELACGDLDEMSKRLVEKLSALPLCPPELFRERGFQTHATDRAKLKQAGAERKPPERALFTGTEVLEFLALPARFVVDPSELSRPLRSERDWREVSLWIRQTARYPIVALASGEAFRNSIIAGFETPAFSRHLLLAYLNATPVRWFHYHRQRDARQGMPQLKVKHLRTLPAPPTAGSALGQRLQELGVRLGSRNDGIRAAERRELDALVAEAWGLLPEEADMASHWGDANPPPSSRTLKRARTELPKPLSPLDA